MRGHARPLSRQRRLCRGLREVWAGRAEVSGGHGVWLSDDEFRRLSASGGAITFCPCSNLFLGSGLFRLGRATDPAWRVRLSFGTDVGGGTRLSMPNVLV